MKAGETMKVAELKEFLEKYPENMPVVATCEGVLASIAPEDFYVETPTPWQHEDIEPCLVIKVA